MTNPQGRFPLRRKLQKHPRDQNVRRRRSWNRTHLAVCRSRWPNYGSHVVPRPDSRLLRIRRVSRSGAFSASRRPLQPDLNAFGFYQGKVQVDGRTHNETDNQRSGRGHDLIPRRGHSCLEKTPKSQSIPSRSHSALRVTLAIKKIQRHRRSRGDLRQSC